MIRKVLHDDGRGHTWTMFGRDPSLPGDVIDTNEYLIVSPGNVILVDPGGTEIFPAVVSAVSGVVDVSKVKNFVCSHQDPDIMSSLPLWMGLAPDAKIHMSWVWTGFVAHFGHEYTKQFVAVPDEGATLPLGGGLKDLQLVPAHYCHSSGNFSVYDPNAKILFSGDIGAAILPPGDHPPVVASFAAHVPYMESFHRRWLPSNVAKNAWVARVRKLDVRQLCPQHGTLFQGDDVKRFLDWLEALEVGGAVAVTAEEKAAGAAAATRASLRA